MSNDNMPQENATVYPAAGDICWGYFPPYTERGFGEGVWDIAIIYGRETRFYINVDRVVRQDPDSGSSVPEGSTVVFTAGGLGLPPVYPILREHLRGNMPEGIDVVLTFVDEIPRTSTGKMLKAKLREDYKDWRWT